MHDDGKILQAAAGSGDVQWPPEDYDAISTRADTLRVDDRVLVREDDEDL